MDGQQTHVEAGYRYLTYFSVSVRVSDGVLRLYRSGLFRRHRVAKFARLTWSEAVVNGNDAVRVAVYDPPWSKELGSPKEEAELRRPKIPTLGESCDGGPFLDADLVPTN